MREPGVSSFEDIVCDLSILISYKVLLTSTHKRGVATVVLLGLLLLLVGRRLSSPREMRQVLAVGATAARGVPREGGMMHPGLQFGVQRDMLGEKWHEDRMEGLLGLGWQDDEGTGA